MHLYISLQRHFNIFAERRREIYFHAEFHPEFAAVCAIHFICTGWRSAVTNHRSRHVLRRSCFVNLLECLSLLLIFPWLPGSNLFRLYIVEIMQTARYFGVQHQHEFCLNRFDDFVHFSAQFGLHLNRYCEFQPNAFIFMKFNTYETLWLLQEKRNRWIKSWLINTMEF